MGQISSLERGQILKSFSKRGQSGRSIFIQSLLRREPITKCVRGKSKKRVSRQPNFPTAQNIISQRKILAITNPSHIYTLQR